MIALLLLQACRNGEVEPEPIPEPEPEPPSLCPDESWATWENHAEPLITTWCQPCHTSALPAELRQGAPVGIDFDSYAAVEQWSTRIVDRLAVRGDMPPTVGPTDEERARFAEWVSCGLPTPPEPPVAGPCDALEWVERAEDLCVGGNALLGDLAGPADLTCLCEVQGDVQVTGVTVDAPLLAAIGGAFTVEGTAITRVVLPSLASVGGAVRVVDNPALATLELPSLATVGGGVEVARNALGLVELAALATVAEDLRIGDDPTLTVVDLARLETVGGTLELHGLRSLVSLRNPDKIAAVGGDLVVDDAPSLTMLGSFLGLGSVGGELLIRDTGLAELSGFLALTSVGGSLTVSDNGSLAEIWAFDALTTVGGTVEVSGNPSLALWAGSSALTTVGGSLLFVANEHATQLLGFQGLVTVSGELTVTDDPMLAEINAFRALATCGGITLAELPSLGATPSLDALAAVGRLELVRTGVADLDGLDAVALIQGNLRIEENPALVDLAALTALTEAGGLAIVNNPLLPNAQAVALASRISVPGRSEISGNGP